MAMVAVVPVGDAPSILGKLPVVGILRVCNFFKHLYHVSPERNCHLCWCGQRKQWTPVEGLKGCQIQATITHAAVVLVMVDPASELVALPVQILCPLSLQVYSSI